MVETSPSSSPTPHGGSASGPDGGVTAVAPRTFFGRRPIRLAVICLASALAITAFTALNPFRSSSVRSSIALLAKPTASTSTGGSPARTITPTTSAPTTTTPATTAPAPVVTTTTTRPTTVTPAPVAVLAAAQPAAAEPPIATLVAEVEATGIDPGSNWSWSMGDTATRCGPIPGAGTGCTFGAAGLEYTVFAGTPNLSLVAHELANAETQNDAVPDLLSDVASAEAGSSWSPTDAVASCLVTHFMGVQDVAAGAWVCSPALSTFVANNIHDTLSTTVGAVPG